MSQQPRKENRRQSLSAMARRQVTKATHERVAVGAGRRRPLADKRRNDPEVVPAKCAKTFVVKGKKINPETKENVNPLTNRSFGKPPNTPKSQYDEVINDLTSGHDTMMAILTARGLKIHAAACLHTEGGATQVLSHVTKTNDDAHSHDMIPILAKYIDDKKLTAEALVPLKPVLENLLKSTYESYVISALQFLETVILSMNKACDNGSLPKSRASKVIESMHGFMPSIKNLEKSSSKIAQQAKDLLQKHGATKTKYL